MESESNREVDPDFGDLKAMHLLILEGMTESYDRDKKLELKLNRIDRLISFIASVTLFAAFVAISAYVSNQVFAGLLPPEYQKAAGMLVALVCGWLVWRELRINKSN